MRNRTLVCGSLAALGLVISACRGGSEKSATPPPPSTTAPSTVASPPPPPTTAAAPAEPAGALRDPSRATERAPDRFRVRFDTTKGPFVVEVIRSWAPQGADRFFNLVKAGFFDDITFFRVIPGFMVQFGIHGDPKVAAVWQEARIPDDPVKQTNRRGALTFATAGPNTRTTQVFINFKNNAPLDGQGFAPFGSVVEGMEVVDSLHSGYGEGAPRGAGPDQGRAQMEGNAYFRRDFPKLDSVKKAQVVGPTTAPAAN